MLFHQSIFYLSILSGWEMSGGNVQDPVLLWVQWLCLSRGLMCTCERCLKAATMNSVDLTALLFVIFV